ncbi:MAG: hypothetical protein AAGJ82_00895 [Bacteroidota bacterium]
MNSLASKFALRFGIFWLIQVAVLRYMVWGWGGEVYLQFFLYPLFILLLPFRTPRIVLLLLAFALGLSVDFVYNSIGLHAGTLVFTAFLRDLVYAIIKPREGYSLTDTPTKYDKGDAWFLRYAALMLLIHFFFYYSLEAFTYYYWWTILIKIVFSWIGSMALLLMWIYVFNPKE